MLGKRKMIFAVAAVCLLLGSCTVTGPKTDADVPGSDTQAGSEALAPGSWQTISAKEAKRMMADGECVLVDVRTDDEYREAHIEGAVLIPYDEIELRAEAELPDKDSVLLVYCRSGRRSATAAETLAGMGYTKVYDFGGIQDWPYDTVSGDD